MAYTQSGETFYAARTTSGWQSKRICGASCDEPSLAFTSNGVPVAAYRAGGDIWYGYRTTGGWSAPVRIFRHFSQATSFNRPRIATGPNGGVAAVAIKGSSLNRESTDIYFRQIKPWSPIEVALTSYAKDALFLTLATGSAKVTFADECACAGGGSGGQYFIQQY